MHSTWKQRSGQKLAHRYCWNGREGCEQHWGTGTLARTNKYEQKIGFRNCDFWHEMVIIATSQVCWSLAEPTHSNKNTKRKMESILRHQGNKKYPQNWLWQKIGPEYPEIWWKSNWTGFSVEKKYWNLQIFSGNRYLKIKLGYYFMMPAWMHNKIQG